jgi:hypothetical protein
LQQNNHVFAGTFILSLLCLSALTLALECYITESLAIKPFDEISPQLLLSGIFRQLQAVTCLKQCCDRRCCRRCFRRVRDLIKLRRRDRFVTSQLFSQITKATALLAVNEIIMELSRSQFYFLRISRFKNYEMS